MKREKGRDGGRKREVRIQLSAHTWEAPLKVLGYLFLYCCHFSVSLRFCPDTDVKTERQAMGTESCRGPSSTLPSALEGYIQYPSVFSHL